MRQRLARIGRGGFRAVTAVFLAIWRFFGRVGLALRKFLTWFVWYPIFYITLPIWLPLRWLLDSLWQFAGMCWRFMGRLGLAIRMLLLKGVIRPVRRFIIYPIVWYVKNLVIPFGRWVWRRIRIVVQWGLTKTAYRRALYRKRWGSSWHLFWARMRVAWRRPSSPVGVEVAPRQPQARVYRPRTVRLATAVAAVSLLILVGVLSLQEQQGQFVAASSAEPITIILTPTPQPATATPVPTVSIQLTPWVTPDPTTGGGVIAFAQTVEGNSDIYVLPVGQSEPVRVTTHPAPDKDPIWSPDGTQIAFTSRRDGNWDVYVYTIPEGRLRRVTRGLDYDGAPTWSPDSQWLAYESYQDGNLDIYLVKADASEGPFRLTYHSAPDFAPAWSPDGRYMAFTSWRSGNQDIFVQSLDDPQGDRVTNVTQSPAVHEDGAAFSPDGRYLAYFEHSAGFPIVFTQPLDEMNAPVGEPVSLGQQGEMPAWSPDSQSLIYVHEKNGRAYLVAGSLEAWGVAPQVFTAPGQLQSPSWTAVNLSPSMARTLEHIDGSPKDGPLYVEAIARPERGRAPVLLWELPVNAPMPYLSDQVDQSFEALRERVIVEAGWDFLGQLDGMFEDIEAKPLPGQSVESWSKAGRAFDLYYRDALGFEPKVFVTREEVGPETYWRVFIKTAVQDGSQGEPLTVLTWDFQARTGDDPQYYLQGGKWSEAVPAGYFVDFTALAADYGWSRVSANENWRTFFPDIRFWHYEKQQNLTWIEAMQQLYTESELAAVVEP